MEINFESIYDKPPLVTLNLDNPIFAMYVNVDGLSRQQAHESIHSISNNFNIYDNVTMWIIASNVSKVECVYDGRPRIRKTELNDLIKEINTRIEVLSNSHSFDDFKINIRDWRIGNIINGTEEK